MTEKDIYLAPAPTARYPWNIKDRATGRILENVQSLSRSAAVTRLAVLIQSQETA